jgi:hypothetical protein
MLSSKLKLNAPNAHTWLEIVYARWGATAHKVFMFFGLATNFIVSAMLALGGSATVTDLTGTNYLEIHTKYAFRGGADRYLLPRHEHYRRLLPDPSRCFHLRHGRRNARHPSLRLVCPQ